MIKVQKTKKDSTRSPQPLIQIPEVLGKTPPWHHLEYATLDRAAPPTGPLRSS